MSKGLDAQLCWKQDAKNVFYVFECYFCSLIYSLLKRLNLIFKKISTSECSNPWTLCWRLSVFVFSFAVRRVQLLRTYIWIFNNYILCSTEKGRVFVSVLKLKCFIKTLTLLVTLMLLLWQLIQGCCLSCRQRKALPGCRWPRLPSPPGRTRLSRARRSPRIAHICPGCPISSSHWWTEATLSRTSRREGWSSGIGLAQLMF